MKRKVQHLVALRADTARDMREYRRSLEERDHRLRAARRSLGITQQIVAANAGFSTVTEARGYIREVDEHNDTLADGVGIEAERVDLGPSIVMLLDEAYEYIDRSRT